MDDLQKNVRGLVSLIEQGSLSLAVWNIYIDKLSDDSLKELALRLRSSLEYGTETKKLRGVPKANYKGAITSWQHADLSIRKAGDDLINAAEDYIKTHSISVV